MQESISNRSFVDISGLGIRDVEGVIGAVGVGFVFQIIMQRKDIIHQVKLEFLDIFLISLTFQKFFPCFENIFKRDDIIIGMNTPVRTPPQSDFAGFY